MDAILMQQKQIIINDCFIENAEDTFVCANSSSKTVSLMNEWENTFWQWFCYGSWNDDAFLLLFGECAPLLSGSVYGLGSIILLHTSKNLSFLRKQSLLILPFFVVVVNVDARVLVLTPHNINILSQDRHQSCSHPLHTDVDHYF